MSLTGPKLDYARIRNAQRKTHKSIYELKDSTSAHINESSRSEIQELGTNPSDKKATPVRKEEKGPQTEDFASVFGQNFHNGNLEYLTSLISDNKAVGSSLNPKNRSNAKGRSHLRAKSTLMGSSNKPQADQSNNENVEPVTSTPNTQNIVNTGCGTTQASSLKPDIDYESTIFQIEIEKEPTPRHHNFSQRNPNNTPAIKEDRLFDNFFKKGGLMRRSMSLEDLRFEKRLGGQIINEEKSPCQSPKEFKIGTVDKSPEPSHRPDASFGVKGDFLASLNNYIHYFDKSENTSQRTKQKLANQYFVQDTRAGQFLKKELEAAQNEVKSLKRHLDGFQAKIFDLAKMNKHLIKELSEVKGREEEYQQRIQGIESQFFQLNQRKEQYKAKYIQTQELLEMERADNENNLVVLKKLFANNINHALDPKMTGFHSHTREKIGKEKDQLKMLLKEVLHQKTNKDVAGTHNRMKDKRTPSHIFNNNRYDPQYNMKVNKTKDMMKYNISTISHKAGLRSEEEDYLQDENIDASESSARYGNMDETEEDTYQEPYSPDDKQLSKEQYIRLLQDKLVELSGAQNVNPFTYEKGVNHQRNMNKSKHKVSDTSIPNYFGMREKERKLGYQKSSNHILRFDHPLKYKNRNELDIDGPMDGVNNFRSQNDSD